MSKHLYLTKEGYVIKNDVAVGYYGDNNRGTLLKLPENILGVDKGAIGVNPHAKTIVLPEGLEEIGQGAFSECSALEHITLPASLKRIGEGAFRGCLALKELAIPEGVEIIEEGILAFSGVTSINVPDSLKRIVHAMFGNESNIQHVTMSSAMLARMLESDTAPFSGSQLRYLTIDGIGYNTDKYFDEIYVKQHKDIKSVRALWGTPLCEEISLKLVKHKQEYLAALEEERRKKAEEEAEAKAAV